MTTKSQADPKSIVMLAVFTLLIFSTLYTLTTNTEAGPPKDDTTNVSCEEYDLRAVECPWRQNQTIEQVSNNRSVTSYG